MYHSQYVGESVVKLYIQYDDKETCIIQHCIK